MRLLSLIGLLAIVVGIAALVFFFGGFFNVSAQNEEPAPVKWALIKVRMAAVDRYATDQPPSGYDAQDKVQAGAKAYSARGCTNCHGGPGVEWQKFSEGLRPDPPDLTKVVKEREPRHLFWVDQERHQHDRHAELRSGRRARPGNLVDGGVPEEAARREGRRLQEVGAVGALADLADDEPHPVGDRYARKRDELIAEARVGLDHRLDRSARPRRNPDGARRPA